MKKKPSKTDEELILRMTEERGPKRLYNTQRPRIDWSGATYIYLDGCFEPEQLMAICRWMTNERNNQGS